MREKNRIGEKICNEADDLAVLTYPDGGSVQYAYDLNGNLIQVIGYRVK